MSDSSQPPTPPAKTVAAAPAPDASRIMTLFVMIVATLYFGREVLVPVTLALLLAFVLAPLVGLLRRLHFGKVPSVLVGVVLALGVILAIGGVIGSQIAELTTDIPKYATTVEAKVASVRSYTVGRLSHLADSVGSRRAGPRQVAGSSGGATPVTAQPNGGVGAPPRPAAASTTSPLEVARTYLAPILSPLATLGIVFVVAVFALLQREDLRDRLIRLVGSDDLHRTTLAIDDGARRLIRYFLTQLSINTGFGIVVGTGLLIIGVPNPCSGAVSSREVALDALARLETVNPSLNAVVDYRPEVTLYQADAVDARVRAGDDSGTLVGVPVTVKVNIDQAAFAATNGVALQKDVVAQENSPVVDNLLRAGAVVLGRTNTPAFSYRWFTENRLDSATRNPRDPRRTPGGSCGGAASAVTAGIGAIGLGTDIAGSIRYPAYACGVHGLRPTPGRVAAYNASLPDRTIGPQLTAVAGPIARTIADIRLELEALAAPDDRDPWLTPAPLAGPPAPLRAAM